MENPLPFDKGRFMAWKPRAYPLSAKVRSARPWRVFWLGSEAESTGFGLQALQLRDSAGL
jgi:hypothetical protein